MDKHRRPPNPTSTPTSSTRKLRFVRLNPLYDSKATLTELKRELEGNIRSVPWLPEYFVIPGDTKLQQLSAWRTGKIYGQDVSSGSAIEALDLRPGHRVLDLCCCPGLKLCSIADKVGSKGTVVGVDISGQRLNACKRILHKYQVDPPGLVDDRACVRLYHNDGTNFGKETRNLVWDSVVAASQAKLAGKRKRMNKSAKAREQMLLTTRTDEDCEHGRTMLKFFDRVLVDAECSTDGSVIHTEKKKDVSWKKDGTKKAPDLQTLQRNLILRGYELLKPGGILVYSTCSMMESLNEEIVSWLLRNHPNAKIRAFSIDDANPKLVQTTSLEGTIKFLPNVDGDIEDPDTLYGGGFFLAKLAKAVE